MLTILTFFRRRMKSLTGEVGASVNEALILMGAAALLVAAVASSDFGGPGGVTARRVILAGGGSSTNNSNEWSTMIFNPSCSTPTSGGYAPRECPCGITPLLPCEPNRQYWNGSGEP